MLAIGLAREVGDFLEEAHAHHEVVNALYALGDLQGAERHSATVLSVAEKSRHNFWISRALGDTSALSAARGNWQEARHFSDRCLAIFPLEPGFLCNRAVLEYHVGEFDQGKAHLEKLLEVMEQNPSAFPSYILAVVPLTVLITARITGVAQYLDIARMYAERALSYPEAPPMGTHRGHLGLALMAVEQNDARAARELFTHLRPLHGTMPLLQALYTPVPAVDRVLGLLSHTIGNLDQAVSYFEDALSLCRRGYRPELAWTCYDYAVTLLQRNATGDHAKASSLLVESRSITAELGMRPLTERVVGLQEQVRLQQVRAPVYPDGLTEREVQVLRLVATGKRDREIAGELGISVTTVSTHVRNILNKINATNRTEATAYAAQHDLL
jgi:DNA-binding CsgD family transcriptional regulator/tetratricopeptide (TPR) repeat protein